MLGVYLAIGLSPTQPLRRLVHDCDATELGPVMPSGQQSKTSIERQLLDNKVRVFNRVILDDPRSDDAERYEYA